MRTVTKTIDVYKFDELGEDAKDRAIDDTVAFIIETTDFDKLNKDSNLYKAYRRTVELKTPWFLGSHIMERCEAMVMKLARQWEYTEDGEVFAEC